ncbi:MAG: L-glutamate gamma-semialdehyde dehydrogenase [Chloroflexota bacterium]|nr:L-glutamate gamma-semialdehyde dehydrogenase [Chloroflexota bacterium]
MTTHETEREIYNLGRDLIEVMDRHRPHLWEGEWWYEQLVRRAVSDEALKTQLLRFVDVFPMLQDEEAVASHFRDYFGGDDLGLLPRRLSTALTSSGLARPVLSRLVQRSVLEVGRRFIAGRTAREAVPVLEGLHRQGLGFSLDLLGEATVSEAEADEYEARYIELLDTLDRIVRDWPANPALDEAPWGAVPRLNISIKLTSLYSQFIPTAPDDTAAQVCERMRPIMRRAVEAGAFVNVDMEQCQHKDLTLRILRDLLAEPEFASYPHVGVALQTYLFETLDDLRGLAEFAKDRGAPLTIRLVKGAYWDEERIVNAQRGWPIPVFESKAETDANFERCTEALLDAYPHLLPTFGTHNARSVAHAIVSARERGLPPRALEFQLLYGMAEALQAAVASGERLRIYTPVGELIPGMGYLVRRLLENASSQSWLFEMFEERAPIPELLAAPGVAPPAGPPSATIPRVRPSDVPGPFRNVPDTPFHVARERQAFAAAIAELRARLPETCGPLVAGEYVETANRQPSVNPARPDEVICDVGQVDVELTRQAIEVAAKAFPAWRDRPARERAQVLFDAAAIMRRERHDLAAIEILEEAKPWREADADIAEAIDHLEYYAREAIALASPLELPSVPGEYNDYRYQPRGVAAIISPWNFPLAIPCGMMTAALVTGNAVILKPAGPAPLIAARLVDILCRAGAPTGVVQFLPGPGSAVGATLVEHPNVALIAFTGSREVGLWIVEKAGQTKEDQRGIKKVIAEMGGKNAIIVDDDADLDQAILGIVRSAFGYAGQKCSACSRVIALDAIYDRLVSRVVEATRSLRVGPAEDPATFVPPVITAEARAGIERYIEIGRGEASLLFQGTAPQDGGFYVAPAIFGDVNPHAVIAQEEIFGPVLAVLRASTVEEAIEIAVDTPYALTGSFYSRSGSHIGLARERFRVGNLYINRGCTGAMVARQPFGGFAMSGIGSKAGGPDYLRQFMEPRTVTENTMRHGFAPTQKPTRRNH